MKYLKYFESSNLDTDEVFEVFQDFIDEFSAIQTSGYGNGSVTYRIIDHSWKYEIRISYWVESKDKLKRDRKSDEIYQYLKKNILSRFDSMGIKYSFSHFNDRDEFDVGYNAWIEFPKE